MEINQGHINKPVPVTSITHYRC